MRKIYRLRRLIFNFFFLGLGILIGKLNNSFLLTVIGCVALITVIVYDFQMEAKMYDQTSNENS